MYEQLLVEMDESVRSTLYKRMDKIIVEESPIIMLYYDVVIRLTQKNVKGLKVNSMNQIDLERVRLN